MAPVQGHLVFGGSRQGQQFRKTKTSCQGLNISKSTADRFDPRSMKGPLSPSGSFGAALAETHWLLGNRRRRTVKNFAFHEPADRLAASRGLRHPVPSGRAEFGGRACIFMA